MFQIFSKLGSELHFFLTYAHFYVIFIIFQKKIKKIGILKYNYINFFLQMLQQ